MTLLSFWQRTILNTRFPVDLGVRQLAIIKAWLLRPAWRLLLTTPNLDKPAP